MHRHTGPAPGIMVWGGIGYHSRTPLVRIAGTLNSQRCISMSKLWRSRLVVSSSFVTSWNFTELVRAVTCMVLKSKANDRRTSIPLP
ncbi:hypothetical protein TNCV_5060441 [Trichonephila clavipes]|nr:hypothetical protein TNCV_5060441 [Trichonephila clavipes]